MSDEKQESLADIVAELRDLSKAELRRTAMSVNVCEPQPTVFGKPICVYFAELADRIEAAAEREKAEAEANALAVGGLVEAERQRVVVSKTETTTPFSLPKAPVRPRRPVANVGQVSDRIRRQAEIIFFGRTA